jgi:hypothetical protein
MLKEKGAEESSEIDMASHAPRPVIYTHDCQGFDDLYSNLVVGS